MKIGRTTLLSFLLFTSANAADRQDLQGRRQRVVSAFPDGILLVHSRSAPAEDTDGFRQDAAFYYLTGLENTAGAILAIHGRSRESWLFLPTRALYWKIAPPEGRLDSAAVRRAGIDHVVDWSELEGFLTASSRARLPLYYVGENASPELPPNVTGQPGLPAGDGFESQMPTWVALIAKGWPAFIFIDARERLYALMDVPSESELVSLRAAANATVSSVIAGMQSVRPGSSQRSAEWAMVNGCWQAGARNSFWPWAMSGRNAVRPSFNASSGRYDHLDRVMKSGDLVRIDDACEVEHYAADLGRTVPASGRFTPEQREIWNALVAAYRSGCKAIRENATTDEVFAAWRAELLRYTTLVKTALAKETIELWSKRENLDSFLVHTLTPDEGAAHEPFRAGTAIAFEPQVSIQGQAFYLEDNFVITHTGTELLSPGLPYTADEIEAVMRKKGRR